MRKLCYIAENKKNLTHHLGKALRGRVTAGERNYIFLNRSASIKKLSFSNSLYENIADDILNGAQGGSYFLDGSSPTNGFSVGGARTTNRKAEELILSGEESKDRENIIAAIELMADEVRYVEEENPNRKVMIGFWKEYGDIFFDASAYFEDSEEEEAARLAFDENNEWAYYDIRNDVTVYLQDYLTNNNMSLDEFVAYKKSSYKFRKASKMKKIDLMARWYTNRKFGGFI